MREFGRENLNCLRSKGTGDFVGSTKTAKFVFSNLLALAEMLRIRFIRKIGISNRSIIKSNYGIIGFNKWNVGGCSLWGVEWYNLFIICMILSSSIFSLWNKDWRWIG